MSGGNLMQGTVCGGNRTQASDVVVQHINHHAMAGPLRDHVGHVSQGHGVTVCTSVVTTVLDNPGLLPWRGCKPVITRKHIRRPSEKRHLHLINGVGKQIFYFVLFHITSQLCWRLHRMVLQTIVIYSCGYNSLRLDCYFTIVFISILSSFFLFVSFLLLLLQTVDYWSCCVVKKHDTTAQHDPQHSSGCGCFTFL